MRPPRHYLVGLQADEAEDCELLRLRGGHSVGQIGRPRVASRGIGDGLHEGLGQVTVDADLDDAKHADPTSDQMDERAFLELHSR